MGISRNFNCLGSVELPKCSMFLKLFKIFLKFLKYCWDILDAKLYRPILNASARKDRSLNASACKKWMMKAKYKSIGMSSLIFSMMPGKKQDFSPVVAQYITHFFHRRQFVIDNWDDVEIGDDVELIDAPSGRQRTAVFAWVECLNGLRNTWWSDLELQHVDRT